MTATTFLRRLIIADAAFCALGGAAFVFEAGLLEGPLGLSPRLLQPVGLILIAYAVVLAALAARPSLPRAVVWALVAFNVAWAVESVALVVLGYVAPTPLGLGLIIAQAAGDLLVADLQFISLRRARREAMA